MKLLQKYEKLLAIISRTPGGVAFSGGADSSLVLKAAVDVFGGSQTPVFFANSILQTEADRNNAVSAAEQIGATLQVVEISPLLWQEFVVNDSRRCYFCKKKVYQLLIDRLPSPGMVLFDGSNLDDLQQDRPGRLAIAELDVSTPLVDAGLGKAEIRLLGKHLGLPTWDRESASCLATRIPEGTRINDANLMLVAAYEKIILGFGFAGSRVRLCADDAQSVKIILKETDTNLICQAEIRHKLTAAFHKLGIRNLWLSLTGR